MEEKGKRLLIAGISGAVGAGFGAASGSSHMLVVISVGVVIALLVAWGISGMIR
ncbi:MAG: hypothetical protein KKF50_00015 [Nanoarchaeota archaeon]|nr:hypothetical protein [Nanoarchaeota archaeon]